jgi:hypothetical protein
MDTSTMSYSDRIARGGGPEASHYDNSRHQKMKLRKKSLLRKEETIGLLAMPVAEFCVECNLEINEKPLRIFGEPLHEACFNARCQKL